MNNPRRYLTLFIAILLGAVVLVITLWQQVRLSQIQGKISALDAGDVSSLVVYEENWPQGEPRVVRDREKIGTILASLKSGKSYSSSHDQQNGFERFVILKPQGIVVSVYQKQGDDSAMIVTPGYRNGDGSHSAYGHIRCIDPAAWKDL